MPEIKSVIFDMDGLLIDSEPYWQDAEIKVFGDIGFELTREMCKQTTGLRIDEVVEHYYRTVGWEKEKFPLQEVAENIVDEVIAAVGREGKPLPGVEKTIHFFVEMRLPMALASSSNMRLIEAVLQKLGIRDHFSVVHSAEFETYGKPHPSTFITTADKLGIAPRQNLVFEDSLNGILAAKSARMFCVAVPEPESPHLKKMTIADQLLPSLEEFTLETWKNITRQP